MASVRAQLGGTFNTNSGTKTFVGVPAVDDLPVVWVANSGQAATPTLTDNNADGLGTYTLIGSAVKASSADKLCAFVRDAKIGSATSTTWTMTPGTTSGGGLIVEVLSGMGPGGASAIRGTGSQDNQSASGTPAPVLPAAATGNSVLMGAVFNATNPAGMTKPSTFDAERFDSGYNNPPTGLEIASDDTGNTDTTVTWGSTSASAFCSMVVEFNTGLFIDAGLDADAETALPVTVSMSGVVDAGLTTSTESALALSLGLPVDVGLATETDASLLLSQGGLLNVPVAIAPPSSNIWGVLAQTEVVGVPPWDQLGATFVRPGETTHLLYNQDNSNGQDFIAHGGWKLIVTVANKGGVPQRINPASMTRSGGKVELTVAPNPHGMLPGQRIFLSGWTPTTYNGNYVIEAVTAGNKIRFVHSDDGAPSVIGDLFAIAVSPDDLAGGGQGFAAYEQAILDLIDNLGGAANVPWLVIENEASLVNQTFYATTPNNVYRNILTHAMTAAHQRGVKVMTDGMLSIVARAGTYWDIRNNVGLTEADDYKARSGGGNLTSANATLAQAWLTEAKMANVDAVNIHFYQYIDAHAIAQTMDWVRSFTGIAAVATNEMGTTPPGDTPTVQELYDGIGEASMLLAVLYAATGTNAVSLMDGNGDLTTPGVNWANLLTPLAQPSSIALPVSVVMFEPPPPPPPGETPAKPLVVRSRRRQQLPPVSWTIDGAPVAMDADWVGNAVADGGFDAFTGYIPEQTLWENANRIMQEATITGRVSAQQVVWHGHLLGDPQLIDGRAKIAAVGFKDRATSASGRLLYQSRDYSLYQDGGSDPMNFAPFSEAIEGQARSAALFWHLQNGFTYDIDDAYPLAAWLSGALITRVAADITKGDGQGGVGNVSDCVLRVQSFTGPSGARTNLHDYALDSGGPSSFDRDIDEPEDGIVFNVRFTASNTTENRYIRLKNLRINGICPGDTFLTSEIVADIGARLGYDTRAVRLSGVNALPFDLTSGLWSDAGLSYMSLLDDWRWLVLGPSPIADAVIDYGPWDTNIWRVQKGQNATPSLEPLPLYNRIVVRYSDAGGSPQQVILDADPNPLAMQSIDRIWYEDLSDAQPNSDLANLVAATLIDRLAAPRYRGSIDIVGAQLPSGLGNAYSVRPGDSVDVTDWAPGLSNVQRINEVVYRSDGVSLGVESAITADGVVAVFGLEDLRRRRGKSVK